MRRKNLIVPFIFGFFILALGLLSWASFRYERWSNVRLNAFPLPTDVTSYGLINHNWGFPDDNATQPIPAFLETGLQYLAKAQAEDGGWGAGLHTLQDVRDPSLVATDPATTAMVAMAFLRGGSSLQAGAFQTNLVNATQYLLRSVERTPNNAQNITDQTGTQPQQKLGDNVDVALTAQFLARLTPHLDHDPVLQGRVLGALDRCVAMLEASQAVDGSWNTRGWAPVLNSAMGNIALELAQRVGRPVNQAVLNRAQAYQQNNVREDGSVSTESAAGIPLYALSSTQRSTATAANTTRQALSREFSQEADTLSYDMAYDALSNQGYAEGEAEEMARAYVTNVSAARQVVRDDVQQGFGNNGGEEFLSHMLTSESLAAIGGEEWTNWRQRMSDLYGGIQNGNGSWSGHHCITSPVFCTAAVAMALTADREPKALMAAL